MGPFTPTARRAWTFKPELQELEARANPSVTVDCTGGTLTVTGDANANSVRITAQGTTFRVTADGQTHTCDDVTKVVLDLKGGDDVARLDLSGARLGDLAIQATMGAGDDRLVVNLGELRRDADVTVTADLGAGDDVFRLRADEVGRDASLTATVDAGGGNDRVVFDLGEIGRGAAVDLTANLGAGDDVFRLNAGEAGRNATASVTVNGGAGEDRAVFDLANRNDFTVNVNADVEHVRFLNAFGEHEHEHEHEGRDD
jgi:hypothetical protein